MWLKAIGRSVVYECAKLFVKPPPNLVTKNSIHCLVLTKQKLKWVFF